jgi:D-ribose pyranose/furanose isomerase RbsD
MTILWQFHEKHPGRLSCAGFPKEVLLIGDLCKLRSVGYSGGVLKTGILNPAINSLVSRIRHTNTLVIADRGFPYWPQIETVDISLVDDIPRVLDVFEALSRNFLVAQVVMAEEFLSVNTPATKAARTAPDLQEESATSHWPDSNGRYHFVCKSDPGIRLKFAVGEI